MKPQKLLVWLTLIFATSAQGCFYVDYQSVRGSGDVAKEERKVRGISGVELETFGTLYIKIGDEEKLEVEAEDNLLSYIETDVMGNKLTIRTRRNVRLRPRKPVKYYLMVKALDTIALTSSGNIEAPNLEAKRFHIKSSSSGSLKVGNLDATTVEVRMSSSGSVNMGQLHARDIEVNISSSGGVHIAGGEVEEQSITISSSGSYRARNLESAEISVRITSSGSATIRVSDYLKASLSSSGSVHYIGLPKVESHVSSSGRVRQVGRSL